MPHATPALRPALPARLARPLVTAVLTALLATAACVDTATTTCAGGLRCPADKVCLYGYYGSASCEAPAAIDACDDKDEGERCSSEGIDHGQCLDRVCKPARCGDGIIDEGEACDDGNVKPGDECSADCQRPCGDGVLQPQYGEICDTGLSLDEYCLDRGFDMGTLTCAASCQEVSTKSCIDFDWQPMARAPADWHFLRVWMFSPDEALAVGTVGDVAQDPVQNPCAHCGHIFRYDGNAWTKERTGEPLLLDLWASGPDDVYAVGISGTILHFDGIRWSQTMGVSTDHHLTAIWGNDTGDLFAVGMHWEFTWPPHLDTARFTILRHDGRTWTPMDLSSVSPEPKSLLYGVWGRDPDDVFAAGTRGTILHYDGNPEGRWMPMDGVPELDGRLVDIWGQDAQDGAVVVVGDDGTILRYEDATWSRMHVLTTRSLTGIWADDRDHLFAVGADGTLLRHEPLAGDEWVEIATGTTSDLLHVHGSTADDIMAVGTNGTVLRRSDSAWAAMDLPGNQEPVNRIWGSGPDCIYAVTGGGEIWHYDGNPDWRWTPMETDTRIHLRSVHGLGCGQDLYAVGWNGTILRHAAGMWTRMSSPNEASLRAVWVAAPDAVFAAGEDGTLLRYDGNAQGRWDLVDTAGDITFTGIWGESASNVFAVGTHGTILRYNGNADGRWAAMDSGTLLMLEDVWGDGQGQLFAVGEGDAVIHYDDMAWSPMDGPKSLSAVETVWGSSASDVFAGTASGMLLHYDGDSWSPMRSPTQDEIESLWTTPDATHLLVGDEAGRIFRLVRPRP